LFVTEQVVALGPYLGPTETELAKMDDEEFERQEAIAREQERADQARAELVEKMEGEKKQELLRLLNDAFPQCTSCPHAPPGEEPCCPGFTPDTFAPTLCVHCKHARMKHSRRHDASRTLKEIQNIAKQLGVDPKQIEVDLPPEDPY
jgi:hypothetical protein